MAAKGFNGFGWLMAMVIVAPGSYLVTSQVAAKRARVQSVERSIAQAHSDIRDLETEFNTRANMAQLERWNSDLLALSSPRADQYLPAGAAGVAELDSGHIDGQTQVVAAVVPKPPVLTDGPAPAEIQASAPIQATPAAAKVVARVETAAADTASKPAAKPRSLASATADTATRLADATVGTAKDRAMAMLDRQLLADGQLRQLVREARGEAGSR